MAIDRIWHKPKGSRRKILRWRVRIRTKLEDGTPYNFSEYYDDRTIAEQVHEEQWRDVKTGKIKKHVLALARMFNAPTIASLLKAYHEKVAKVRRKTGGMSAEKSRCLSTIPKTVINASVGYGRDGDDNLTWFREGTKSSPARQGENGELLVPFGYLHAHTVRRKEIEEYIAARRKAGVTDGTIGREIDILRDAYNRWEQLTSEKIVPWEGPPPANPVLALTKEQKPAKAEERERRLTADERGKLLALAADHRNPEMGVIVVLGIAAAMRLSEMVGLEWRNVDFERRVVIC
jgi:hypothetical protein